MVPQWPGSPVSRCCPNPQHHMQPCVVHGRSFTSVKKKNHFNMLHFNARAENLHWNLRNSFVVRVGYLHLPSLMAHMSSFWPSEQGSLLRLLRKYTCCRHGVRCFSYGGKNLGRNWLGLELIYEIAKLKNLQVLLHRKLNYLFTFICYHC
jgi:hypothetical protein